MVVGIIAGLIVVGVCVVAFALCKAASDWDDYDER